MQELLQMPRLARERTYAAASGESPLPEQYFGFLRWWTALGVVAFVALVVVCLMLAKPM